ncbi:hypothetical protein C8R45DRAFT_1031106 [Mycena sanguinolenta]|nr:hypothetical protein C8R45DRAFT_1031106 [Mycena sanguinolenta]
MPRLPRSVCSPLGPFDAQSAAALLSVYDPHRVLPASPALAHASPFRLACPADPPVRHMSECVTFTLRPSLPLGLFSTSLPRSIAPFSPRLPRLRLRRGRSCLGALFPFFGPSNFVYLAAAHAQARSTASVYRFPVAAGLVWLRAVRCSTLPRFMLVPVLRRIQQRRSFVLDPSASPPSFLLFRFRSLIHPPSLHSRILIATSTTHSRHFTAHPSNTHPTSPPPIHLPLSPAVHSYSLPRFSSHRFLFRFGQRTILIHSCSSAVTVNR